MHHDYHPCAVIHPMSPVNRFVLTGALALVALAAAFANAEDIGACCYADGTCLILTQPLCENLRYCRGDANCDGVVNFADIDRFVAALSGPDAWNDPNCPWRQADCDGDTFVDFGDIDPFVARLGAVCSVLGTEGIWAGAGTACDADRCLTDCNGNGIHDPNDITSGFSADCNLDGIPDECQDCDGDGLGDVCQIDAGAVADINGNYIPDTCEYDCNANGVPDTYEIEEGFATDCDQNGVPDTCDILLHTASDCNDDGVPDACQLDGADCNANGVPDDCEADCNGNGQPDDCDVLLGGLADADGNLVPDACQPDCNGNGLPDALDIAQGTATDCNANGNPDACDLASGASLDRDSNGIADECEPHCQSPCDFWETLDPGVMGPAPTRVDLASLPIPADFFGPGSEPFDGVIELAGRRPLDANTWTVTDTVISRAFDPFQPNQPPQGAPVFVPLMITSLSLQSVQPIAVTFAGQNEPQLWNVEVTLSSAPQPPGDMQVFKTHPNGGFYGLNLPIVPRLVFRPADDPSVGLVRDYGTAGLGPWILNHDNVPWVHQADPNLLVLRDPGSQMVAGITENPPGGPQTRVPVMLGGPVLQAGQQCPPNVSIDLDIFDGLDAGCANGCGGKEVPDAKEVSRGAVTVANLNDTDNDGIIDRDDGAVLALNASGRSEIDLMKIILRKPTPDLGGVVELKVIGGDVKAWLTSSKVEAQTLPHSYPTAALPVTLYVEARGVSSAVRDIGLEAIYNPPPGGSARDEVRGTGAWATRSLVKVTRALADNTIPEDADRSGYQAFINRTLAQDGTRFGVGPNTTNGTADTFSSGRILQEFLIAPSGVDSLPIRFDVSRAVYARDYRIASGAGTTTLWTPGYKQNFPEDRDPKGNIELPNDDRDDSDEDNGPTNRHIYSWDTPGQPLTARERRSDMAFWVRRDTFREFVRVRVGFGQSFANKNGTLEGSRASDFYPWHYVDYLVRDGEGNWTPDTLRTSNSAPVRSGQGNGTATARLESGATTEGFTATYTQKRNTWTLTGTSGVSISESRRSTPPGTTWTLTLPGRVKLVITGGSSGFKDGSQFTFSTFKSATDGRKQNVNGTGAIDPSGAP